MSFPGGVRVRVAVLVREGNSILMVRHRKDGREYWLAPGGGIEPGETIEAAALREMLEETGLTVRLGRLLLVCDAIDPNGSRHVINLFFSAAVVGGELRLGDEPVLAGATYLSGDELAEVETYPPVGAELAGLLAEKFEGPVRFLGNVWRE
ncbi:MAG: NUDIX domain-containing protein [Candidatus Dormibacteria bacterium]